MREYLKHRRLRDLDLDKIDLALLFDKPEPADNTKSLNRSNQWKFFQTLTDISSLRVMLLLGGVILLLSGIYFLLSRSIIKVPFLDFQRAPIYASIGPVVGNLETGTPIKISLKFELKHSSLRDRVDEMSILIRDKMLIILSSLNEKDIFGNKDLKFLKNRIKFEVEGLLKENSIEGVYFSEIFIY